MALQLTHLECGGEGARGNHSFSLKGAILKPPDLCCNNWRGVVDGGWGGRG